MKTTTTKTIAMSIILFLLFVGNVNAGTIVNSNIYTNTTWTAAGSPYIVSTNLIVFEPAQLTIDPGVIVKVDRDLGIEIRGTLKAVGNLSEPITFTTNAANPTMGIWKGFRFVSTSNPLGVGSQVTMDYCIGMYAERLLDMDLAYHGPYIYEHCLFYKNIKVNYDGGMPTTIFNECLFVENQLGLEYPQFGGKVSKSAFINNVDGISGFENADSCLFYGNTGVALSAYGSTTNCIVLKNNIGVKGYFNSVNKTFRNNYVGYNTVGVELQSFFNGYITFKDNMICSNELYNIKNSGTNNADLSNNCWCSDDSTFIRSTIYDGYTSGASSGLISFMPYANDCMKSVRSKPAACNTELLNFNMTLATLNSKLITSVKNEDAASKIEVYPNPFSEELTIKISGVSPTKCTVRVYSVLGNEVNFEVFKNENGLTLKRGEHPAGIYFVVIENGQDEIFKTKIVVE
jgi:hypothetical protein